MRGVKNLSWENNDTVFIHTLPNKKIGPISNKIIPAVGYSFPDLESAVATVSGKKEGNYYGRYGNPTTQELQKKIALLENGEAALGVSSGMAAISSALLNYLVNGDHVLCTKDVYGGSYKFLTNIAPRYGISTDFVDCTDLLAVKEAIKYNTKVLYIETPSNPCLTILDIKMLSELAHSQGLKVIIDNTFMTPYLQRPLDLGADLVVHSATKYLNGHGDVIAGFIVGDSKTINNIKNKIVGDLGQVLNSWDSFLIDRGLKSLGVRMRQHCESALKVAKFLEQQSSIEKVYYPGLVSHPQHFLAKQQMRNMGGIVSFEVKGGYDGAKKFIDSLDLAMISFSLGDPETLVQHPATMTHSSIPFEDKEKCNISDGLIRLSVGLEECEDIIRDLEQALSKIQV
ncbi:aminotransferase class I/II-fold pyridoxal phosphate-dependent enzyme [Lysinibacillus fusiformis]|uniref:trans-sulfuration enzyme family protein n=1 Tax=Lysinibacillus fusiformis TaxID=28031 RepID=UPI001966D589|nr:aminotransferase class I/II-fold pyridoxal phosphate-dependent enzyme [Lysinibacillus fusiformis]QSB08733.1 aminotransferase class I/II-fold pyridoxal phosphate-dependent enzyme [Lysinibacillus fusiformis]